MENSDNAAQYGNITLIIDLGRARRKPVIYLYGRSHPFHGIAVLW